MLYAGAESLEAALTYDFQQEKAFNYAGLSRQQIIEHLADFISYLWQIHPFGEGNTRTTAVFLIKYLRKLGFQEANNALFELHSWYFRNALIRANYENLAAGIHKTDQYLVRFLLNLINDEHHPLKNRAMHIHHNPAQTDPVKSVNEPVNDPVFLLISQDNRLTLVGISARLGMSLSSVKRKIKALKEQGFIERIGSDKAGYWKILAD